jgi:hypothetical protein
LNLTEEITDLKLLGLMDPLNYEVSKRTALEYLENKYFDEYTKPELFMGKEDFKEKITTT